MILAVREYLSRLYTLLRGGHGGEARPPKQANSDPVICTARDWLDQAIAIYDSDLRLLFCCDNFARVLGFPDAMCRPGRPISDFIRLNAGRGVYGPGNIEDHVRTRLRTLENVGCRIFARVTLENRVIEVRHNRLTDGRMISTYTDSTAAKKAEDALRASEAKYRELVDGSIEGILIHRDNRIVYANQAAADIFGYPIDELIGMAPTEKLLHPDEVDRIREIREHLPVKVFEYRGLKRDGTTLQLHAMARIVDWEGRRAFQITVQDISARKQAEAALKKSHEEYRYLIENWPQRILIHRRGEIVYANRAWEGIHNYTREELIGRNVTDLTHPDDLGLLKQSQSRDVIPYLELRALKKDGTEVLLACSAMNITWDGKPARLVMSNDITTYRQTEAKLYQAQKMEAVGQLTAGVAHEFNNLLTIVTGNLELLEEKLGGDELAAHMAGAALKASWRGAGLVHRMLAFSRMQLLEPVPANLNSVVTGILDLLVQTIGRKIQISTSLDDSLWPASIDSAQLESSLLNLAINARDAMPDGGLLTIETANRRVGDQPVKGYDYVAPGDYVTVAVRDTGAGMAPEVVEHAFEPFFTTKGAADASGLGLSMVYGFIRQSGGHVTIDSEAGQGTTVRLYLPRVETVGGAEAAAPGVTR